MATPPEKLSESLAELQKLQDSRGIAIIKADDLSRTHRERLLDNGFIREVIKGWYISRRPDERKGDTISWYVSYWDFIGTYIDSRFGTDWCLSPECIRGRTEINALLSFNLSHFYLILNP